MKRSATPSDHGKEPRNAFAVLMSQTKKKKTIDSPERSNNSVVRMMTKSKFLECPAGCGRHFLEKDINDHLDQCVVVSTTTTTTTTTAAPAAAASTFVSPAVGGPRTNAGASPPSLIQMSSSPPPQEKKESPRYNNTEDPTNAFSHMMKKSATVFSSPSIQDTFWAQRFHLNANGSVSVTCYCTNPPGQSQQPDTIEWSANSHIKAPKRKGEAAKSSPKKEEVDTFEPKPVNLALSSAIPSAADKIRLVHRHSKLSIPVLKSILQKAIRRRKALPAVRVAMELADKSLGDLLRRLPIIMFEDSMLHPSLPLLTWLMAAHSKNFEPGVFLLTKVLCAVYEMSSCPWHDRLKESESTPIKSTDGLTFDSFHKPGIHHLLEDHDVYTWSMLLRIRYGGMGCDLQMLDSYVKVWCSRFQHHDDDDCNLPESIRKRFVHGDGGEATTLRWSTFPITAHQSAARVSLARIESLLTQRLPGLELADIPPEGIDFHCSGVLDDVLSDPWLVHQCLTQIGALSTSVLGLGPVPPEASEKRSWLERVLKKCMWDYSSGVNRRLPLLLLDDERVSIARRNDNAEQDPLKTIWQSLILPKTRAFAENYVISRLQKL